MVLLLRPEEVPKDLICSICMSVPSEPCSLEPCDHVFCRECARETLSRHQSCCPVDRTYCRMDQIRPFKDGSLVYRIWCTVMIKCEHCNWTGSIADGQSHEQKCRKARSRRSRYVRSDSDKDLIDTLKAAKVALENDKAELEDELNEMVHQLNLREAIVETQDYRCRSLQGENGRLSQQVSELEFQNSKLQMETQKLEQIGKLMQNQRERPLIRNTGAYDYDRFTVVRLTKLICQDLENKPTEINANKIFDCVRCIYQDFERGYNDSPDNLYIDVRMLLAVCMASTWFTPRQEENYERWMSEEGWC